MTGTVTSAYNYYAAANTGGTNVANQYGFFAAAMTNATNNYPLYLSSATLGQPIMSVSGTGQALYQNSTDSSTAFQILNAAGNGLLKVSTASTNSNLITNPSFESSTVGTTGWAARAGTTLTRTTTSPNYYYGTAAGQAVVGTGSTNAGVNYPIQLSPSTTYQVSVMMKMSLTGTASFGYAADGSTETTYVNSTAYQNGGTGWYQACVSFTTPATVNSAAYIFLKQNDTSTRTVYIDGLRAAATSTTCGNGGGGGTYGVGYQENQISIGDATTPVLIGGSAINTPSSLNAALTVQQSRNEVGLLVKSSGETDFNPDVFQVQSSAGNPLLAVTNLTNATYIFGGNGFYDVAALNVTSTNIAAVAARFIGSSGQTADIFQVQSNAGVKYLTVGNTGTLTVGNSGNTVSISVNGIVLSGTARNAKVIRLNAEYPSAVLDTGLTGNNSGTMTSGNDLTNRMNYYKWTTTSGTAQSYDIDVQVPIPSDFSAWSSSTPISFTTYTSNTSTGTITVEARSSAGTVETGCNFVSVTPGSTGTWATNSSSCTLAGTYTAGDYMTLRIRLSSPTSGDVRVGNIVLNYLSKF